MEDVLKVEAERLNPQVDDVGGVVHDDGDEEEDEAEPETDLADPPDAVLDAGEDGDGGDGRDAPDGDHLDADVVAGDVAVEDVEALVDLDGAESEAGADAEQRGNDGDTVDQVARPAEDLVADERIKAGLHGEWKAEAVGHEGEGEADHGVDDPGMEAPVVEGQVDGVLGQAVVGEGRVGTVSGRGGVMPHRLGNTEEEQT